MKNSAVHPFPSKLPPVKPTPKGAFLLKVSMVPLETGVPGAMPLEECNKVDNAQKKNDVQEPCTYHDETPLTNGTDSGAANADSGAIATGDRSATAPDYKERLEELEPPTVTCCWRPSREVEMEQIMKHLDLDIQCDVCWSWLQINMNRLSKYTPKRRLLILNEGNSRLGSYKNMHSKRSRIIMASLIGISFILFLLGVILMGLDHSKFRPFDTMVAAVGGFTHLIVSILYISCVMERWTQKHTCKAWKVDDDCFLP